MRAFLLHHKITVLIVCLLLIGTLGILLSVNSRQAQTVLPRYGDVTEAIYGLGKVRTDRVYEVKLAVVKTVERLFVSEGDSVKQGDPLVKMEGNALFRAPFTGVVTQVVFHESQPVFPQQVIVRVEDVARKYIEVALEQQGALRVRKGQPVRVLFESVRGEQLSGKVSAVFARNEEFLAHIEVAGLGDNVLPGMTADVAIEVETKQNVLLIPVSALSNGTVKVRREDKIVSLNLKIGSVDGNWAEVLEGDVRETDALFVSGGRP